MLLGVLLFITGLIFGSFINAFLYRYQNKMSFGGRSFCPKCKKQIFWYDNIPLISWVILKARCRNCKKPISIQYPLVEMLSGLLVVTAGIMSGFIVGMKGLIYSIQQFNYLTALQFILLSSLFLTLLTISVYDIKTKEIPNGFNLAFILLAAFYLLLGSSGTQYDIRDTIYHLLASGVAFLFFYTFVFFSKEKWMGGGDAKFAFGIGLLLGPIATFLAIFLASWLGAIYGLFILGYKKLKIDNSNLFGNWKLKIENSGTEIPFGPFLALGCFISFFWGSQIIDWYVKIFLGL